MSYTEEAVKARLNSLNDTADSIVHVSQWILFHRRHADSTVAVWLARLQEVSSSKRLILIYLANEVAHGCRARNRTDFIIAFEAVLAEAVAIAYKGASQDVQAKIRRTVEVWRERKIFDAPILDTVEGRLEELDKQRAAQANGGPGRKLGGSLFGGGGSVPAELETAAKLHAALSKADAGVRPAVDKANTEYGKYTDPDTPIPTAPLHAAKLSALMKNLAAAQGAVEASLQAREGVLAELEKLLERQRGKLAEDQATVADLASRKEGIEAKKKDVEDSIMRGMSTPTSGVLTPDLDGGNGSGRRAGGEGIQRPEAEGFTPPPPDVEAFTPPATDLGEGETGDVAATPISPAYFNPAVPNDEPYYLEAEPSHTNDKPPATSKSPPYVSTTGAEALTPHPPHLTEPAPTYELPPAPATTSAAAAANKFLNELQLERQQQGTVRQASGEAGDPRLKRRKLSQREDEEIFGGELGGVDEEGVSALLGS